MTTPGAQLETRALRMLRDGYSTGQVTAETGLRLDQLRQLAADFPGHRPVPSSPTARGPITELPVRVLVEHPGNVRSDLGDLAELEQSVTAQGILQPLLVTRGEQGQYVVIGGHRRLAAAIAVGLPRVPVHVRGQLHGTAAVEAMLVENLQRVALSPLDEARAYRALLDAGRTQGQVAAAVGKNQGHISSRLALLNLTPSEQSALERKEITISAGYRTGRERSPGRMQGEQSRPKPKRVPHFTADHALAAIAGKACDHEVVLKLGPACGPCWERAIRDDVLALLEQTETADA